MSTLREQLDLLKIHLDEKGIMDPDESQALIDTIEQSDLPQQDIDALIVDISTVADMPLVTDTREKVARWRKIIISLMLAGITGFALENIIPGIYYTLYERISTTITSLLIAGISSVQIREIINNPPSIPIPNIPISSPNIPGLMASLTEALKTGFFTAASIAVGCINMVCSRGQQVLNQLTIENFNYTAKLAGQLAIPKGISYAYRILRGELDETIARLIDDRVTQQILDSVDDTVTDVKRHIIETVTESAEDVRNIMLGITWTDMAPNSGLDPSINRMINNAISNEIEKMIANPENKASTSKLLNDILNVLRSDDKLDAIAKFKVTYQNIPNTIPELLILLTAKETELRENFDSHSQPTESLASMPMGNTLRKTASLPYSFNFTPEEDGSRNVLHRQKYNSSSFDALKDTERLRDVGILPSRIKVAKITWNKDSDRFLYEFINVFLNNKDPELVKKLNLLSPEDHNAIINRIREIASSNGGYNLLPSLDDPNLDRSNEELYTLFNTIYETIQVQMSTYTGGRNKKSRQYKKRRSTLRRRRVKGRRTRKGKKMRSTKRKR
jgi:hypothetical protein